MSDGFVDTVVRPVWGLWLMGLFVVIVVHAYWPGRRHRLERHADIPLREDEKEDGAWPR